MKFNSHFKDKLGREVILRNAEESDAVALIDYLKIATDETPYLIREPEEITITIEQEKSFIKSKKDADLLLHCIRIWDLKNMAHFQTI